MAKRVVVFEKPESAPDVVVRRKRDAQGAGEKPSKKVQPAKAEKSPVSAKSGAKVQTPGKRTQVDVRGAIAKTLKVAGNTTDNAGAKTPKSFKRRDSKIASDIFKEVYIAEIGRALEIVQGNLAASAVEEREYFADKCEFLQKLGELLKNGTKVEFKAQDEAFFWNEFFRISMTIAKNKPDNCGASKWRKQANALVKVLMELYNSIRARRDGYVLKRHPTTEDFVLFNFCGTMHYIEKQIAETRDNANLKNLLKTYRTLFAKSELRDHVLRLAGKLQKMKVKPDFSGWKIWKNQETVEYVLKLCP